MHTPNKINRYSMTANLPYKGRREVTPVSLSSERLLAITKTPRVKTAFEPASPTQTSVNHNVRKLFRLSSSIKVYLEASYNYHRSELSGC